MIKTHNKVKPGFDRLLLVISIVLACAMAIAAIFSIAFLSNNLFKAFTPKENSESDLQFDIEGYEQVLKDLNRTPAATTSE